MNLIILALLSLALSRIFLLFRVGGSVGEINIKDQLNPAEAGVGTELGKIQ